MANYTKGAQVEHNKFGFGTVESHNDDRIEIKFDDHGTKKFVTSMAMGALRKSDRQPPAEKRASRAPQTQSSGGYSLGPNKGIIFERKSETSV